MSSFAEALVAEIDAQKRRSDRDSEDESTDAVTDILGEHVLSHDEESRQVRDGNQGQADGDDHFRIGAALQQHVENLDQSVK